MYSIIWNISMFSAASLIGWVCINIYDKELAENIKTNVCWYSVKTYHYLNYKCNKSKAYLKDKISKDISNNKKTDDLKNYKISNKNIILSDTNKTFIGYKHYDKTTFEKNINILNDNPYFHDTKFDLMLN